MEKTNPFPTSSSVAGGSASDMTSVSGSSSPIGNGKVDSTGATLHSKVDKVSSVAHETVDRLTASANDVADKLAARTRKMAETPQQALDTSREWVQDKPFAAIGIALAVGYLIGRMQSKPTYYY